MVGASGWPASRAHRFGPAYSRATILGAQHWLRRTTLESPTRRRRPKKLTAIKKSNGQTGGRALTRLRRGAGRALAGPNTHTQQWLPLRSAPKPHILHPPRSPVGERRALDMVLKRCAGRPVLWTGCTGVLRQPCVAGCAPYRGRCTCSAGHRPAVRWQGARAAAVQQAGDIMTER